MLPPRSTLFPYTTLFRSELKRSRSLADDEQTGSYVFTFSGGHRRRCPEVGFGEVCRRWSLNFLPSEDRKSTRLNSSHRCISYAVFCLKKQKRGIFLRTGA